jgi:hypothetical protein
VICGRSELLRDVLTQLGAKVPRVHDLHAAALDGLALRRDGLRAGESGWDFIERHVARVTAELQIPGYAELTAPAARKRPSSVTATEVATARRASRARPLSATLKKPQKPFFTWTAAVSMYVTEKLSKIQRHLRGKRDEVTVKEVCDAAHARYSRRVHPCGWPPLSVLLTKMHAVKRALQSSDPALAWKFLYGAKNSEFRSQLQVDSDSGATSVVSEASEADTARAPASRKRSRERKARRAEAGRHQVAPRSRQVRKQLRVERSTDAVAASGISSRTRVRLRGGAGEACSTGGDSESES